MSQYDNIPTWEEMQDLRMWVMAGCPAGTPTHDAGLMVRRLWKLMEGLPKHVPIYAWGSDEWRAERQRLADLVQK